MDELFRLRDLRQDDQDRAIARVDEKVSKLLERVNQVLVGVILALITIIGGACVSIVVGASGG